MMFLLKLSVIMLTVGICVEAMIVIPERANVTLMNNKYITSGGVNIRRYARNSPYYINVYGVTVQTFDNSFTVEALFSQFLHNEYRRSFVEARYKFCDMVNDEPFVGGMLKKTGLTCPLPPGEHYFMNMTVPTNDFKYVFPFEKGRVDIIVSVTATKETVLRVYVEASFKQKNNLPMFKANRS